MARRPGPRSARPGSRDAAADGSHTGLECGRRHRHVARWKPVRMKAMRIVALAILAGGASLSIGADWLAPFDYAAQFREHANEPPSRQFLLGTDALGRDRFSRLLYGSRVSLLCAPAAALIATALAAAVGLMTGYSGGWARELGTVFT